QNACRVCVCESEPDLGLGLGRGQVWVPKCGFKFGSGVPFLSFGLGSRHGIAVLSPHPICFPVSFLVWSGVK
uniref:Uncharacterized protein n=1 Tax=Cannabis sativa TaxID=3483 RepID=A0A803QRL3_CANSA